MEFLQDFMPVLIISKFEEDLIKTEGAMVSTTFFPALKGRYLRSQWTDVAGFTLLQDFMAVLVTCKFDDDTIKEIFKFKSVKFSSFKGK